MTERYATQVLNYGGGRQTVAMCVLVAEGLLPRPDRIVIADTGREAASTWAYLAGQIRPYLAKFDLAVEVAPHSLATVDIYAHNGDLLLPVFTQTGKLSAYCSGEWKRDVVRRHLRASGIKSATCWIGYGFDEKRRWKGKGDPDGPWAVRFPLVELMVDAAGCERIIAKAGLPMPEKSRCWMCPHQPNAEWRQLRDELPEQWEQACDLDDELREADEMGGVFLHQSRVPLRDADLEAADRREPSRQCTLGVCFV